MTSFPSGGAYVIEDTETGSSRFSSSNTQNVIAIEVPLVSGGNGAVGLTGATGPGVSAGGTSGQFLTKDSGTDYDTSWATIHQVPSGGATAEVLGKASASDYDLEWVAQIPAATTGYVYNSSAVQAGNVYSSWSDLITQLNSVDGDKTVRFQQNETIPTGAWDLNEATLVGNGGNTTTGVRLTFPTGCTISNPGYLMATDGIILYSTSNAAVLTLSSARSMVFENDAIICSKTAAFFTVSATSGLVTFSLRNGAGIALPSDISISGGDYESVNVTGAGVGVNIVDSCGHSSLQDNVIRGGSGGGTTITRYIFSPVDIGASGSGDTQTNASNWSVSLSVPAFRIGFDGDGTAEPVFSGVEHVEDALVALAGVSPTVPDVPNSLWITATNMTMDGGSALANLGGTYHKAQFAALDATTQERCYSLVSIPTNWSTVTIRLWWTNPSSTSGNVRWECRTQRWIASTIFNDANGTTHAALDAAAPSTAATMTYTDVATSVSVAQGPLYVRLDRLAAHANDTLANDAYVGMFEIIRTA